MRRELLKKLQTIWGQNILLWQRLYIPILKTLDITPTEKRVLYGLYRYPNITKNELSEAVVLVESALTRAIGRLEGKKLIKKVENPDDMRSVKLMLTKKGIKKTELIKQKSLASFQAACDTISLDELKTTLKVMETINENWQVQIQTIDKK